MPKQIIIVGGFNEIYELVEECDYEIVGVINKERDEIGPYPLLGNDLDANEIYDKFKNIPIIVTPQLPDIRFNLINMYKNIGFKFCNVVSNSAKISRTCILGEGIVVQHGANISSNTSIGSYSKINTSSNIMHDSEIDEYVTVAPNAVILGYVSIGQCCYIGANSTILPHVRIGNNVTIGAGAVITKDVPDNKIMVGNPARELLKS